MNCEHARLLIGADPYSTTPELSAHLAACPACSEFQREMVALEANIRRALEHAPPAVARGAGAGGAPATGSATGMAADAAGTANVENLSAARSARQDAVASANSSTRRRGLAGWGGWALAASVLVATVLSVWTLRPTDSLAHDVVQHVNGEPKSWESTVPVNAHDLDEVFRKSGAGLNITSGEVLYASTCYFRGHFVPHLVVQTAQGPVTVMVLANEHVSRRSSFYEDGYAGVIVPGEHGSIAVLTHGVANVDDIAKKMQAESVGTKR